MHTTIVYHGQVCYSPPSLPPPSLPDTHATYSENLIRLSIALKNNSQTVITHLDLSDNVIDDKSKIRKIQNRHPIFMSQSSPPPPPLPHTYTHATSAMESLGGALESLPHGLHHLKLANCKITTRGK